MGLELPFNTKNLLRKYHQPDLVFAYGSGVFREQAPKGATQIDFIFGVQNPIEWHANNPSKRTRTRRRFILSQSYMDSLR